MDWAGRLAFLCWILAVFIAPTDAHYQRDLAQKSPVTEFRTPNHVDASTVKPATDYKQSRLRQLWRKKLRKLAKIQREIGRLRGRMDQRDRESLLRQQLTDLINGAKELSPADLNITVGDGSRGDKRGWRKTLLAELKKLNRRLPSSPAAPLLDEATTTSDTIFMPPGGRPSTYPNSVTTETPAQAAKRKRKQKKLGVKVARVLKNLKSGAARTGSHSQHSPGRKPSLGSSAMPVGVAGAKCSTHQDCRPGLCCHQGQLNRTELTCYNHSQTVATRCANSCQCQNDLMCFRAQTKGKLNHKRLHNGHSNWDAVVSQPGDRTVTIERHADGLGMCKVASIDDIHHGIYANNKLAIFTGDNLP